MSNALTHKIGLEWPNLGGSGNGGRLLLVLALVALTHYRYPEMALESWQNLIVGIMAGMGLSAAAPRELPPAPPAPPAAAIVPRRSRDD
jgi:hypothetical protein